MPILEGRNTDQAVLNNVFQLDPPGGSIVNALTEVKVIYNSGPNKKAIINFVGGTDVAAKTNLTALGLPFVINGVESADKPAGTVIAQDPPPGDYPPGFKVTLTVSNGVTQITLPNIALKGRDAVVSELTALGLKPSVELAASDTVEKDKVIGERHYVKESKSLFMHKKSMILQERLYFRNLPLSNWVEHEMVVEEGSDLRGLLKNASVFNSPSLAGADDSSKYLS